ncbi:hypothetical protein [Pelagicoccus albus]|uniref:Uncharacterized protein n=1 Tax=Pelagicoccus albus TaxID=415222 RepID=A0A7X1E6G6_9BACT|nr:hypothetical protein [Pelagicoccus albus]MBC2604670.1 hypothetical protein [Pelagicoccus albus]
MKYITRILQILAVLGAVAAGFFYFQQKTEYRSLDANMQELRAQLNEARNQNRELKLQNSEQAEKLKSQTLDIESLTADSLLANNQLLQIQRENKRLVDERDAQEIAERRLQRENSRLSEELGVLQATSISQDEIADYELQIASLERQILELQQTQPGLAENSLPISVPARSNLHGRILTVGKGNSFVILDIGYSEGVRLQNELYIRHADTTIAKIQVTDVKENLSIARVLPESIVKNPQSGDSVSSLN